MAGEDRQDSGRQGLSPFVTAGHIIDVIGVFDSGLGGLSVLAAVARTLPRADLLYLADTAHVPYGPRSDDFIRSRVLAIGEYLADYGCTTLVAACNTATAAAVESLRQAHPALAVIGIEPGIKPAAASSKSRHIAVLATESTARSARLKHLIETHANTVTVHIEPCPGWATRVETLHMNNSDDADFNHEIAEKILPLLDRGIDRIVLGCTHYAFLADRLAPLIAGRAELVEVAEAVAREVARRTATTPDECGRIRLQATANPERLHTALIALGLETLLPHMDSPALLVSV